MRAAVLMVPMLAACTSLTVREPICEPPAIPVELLQPCEEPAIIADGSMATLFQQSLRDLAAWGRCIRKDDALVAVVKFRDDVCAKIKADNAKPKPWWQFGGS